MTDPKEQITDPSDQYPIVLERRHIEALLGPDKARSELRQEARQLLSRVLSTEPIANPREAGGHMVDVTGDPHARDSVMIDARRAVLVEAIEAAVVHATRKGVKTDMVGFTLTGRINRPPNMGGERPAERVSHLHLMEWDGAANIIVEIKALAGRAGFDLVPLLEKKWAAAEAAGFTRRRG